MGRHDQEDLPPVEVLGAEPRITSLVEVSTGGAGGPHRRRTALVLALVVLGLLLAGVLLGDDGTPTAAEPEEETSSTRETTTTRERGSTTTRPATTTTTIPSGPLFPGFELRGWLLSGSGNGWTLVDIATGNRGDPQLPFDDPYSTRALRGGVVTLSLGTARYYPLGVPVDERAPVDLGPADQILGTVDRDKVWLVQGSNDPLGDDRQARLVDLDGGVLKTVRLPRGDYQASTAEGVLLSLGGRVYLASESGVESVAIGDLVGAAGSSILVFTCAEDASECAFELRTTGGSLIRRLAADPSSQDLGWTVSTAEDGRFALVTYQPPDGYTSSITLVQPDGQTIATMDTAGPFAAAVAWLPGDAGLVGARNNRMVWIHDTGDGWSIDDIPSLAFVESMGLLPVLAE